MFQGGSIWRPPPMNPYATAQTQVAPQTLPAAPVTVTHLNVPKQEKVESEPEPAKKQLLSDRYLLSF